MTNKAVKGTIEDLKEGKRIKLMKIQNEFLELLAYNEVLEKPDDWEWKGKPKSHWVEYFKANIPKEKKWSEYAFYLAATQPTKWIRENWMKKTDTTMRHWANTGSAVLESIRDAMLVLSDSKNKKYLEYKEDFTKGIWWDQVGFTDISKMPIVKLFRYNEDSPENQVRAYIKNIVEDIESEDEANVKEALDELYANDTLRSIVFGENGTLEEIGKTPKHLWYIKEPWLSQDNFVMIRSAKESRMYVLGDRSMKEPQRVRESADVKTLVAALNGGSARYWRDEVKSSGNFKRLVIAMLRGDVNFTYLGFSPSAEQKMIREQGMAAFSTKQEEKEKALKSMEVLKVKMEQESKKEERQQAKRDKERKKAEQIEANIAKQI